MIPIVDAESNEIVLELKQLETPIVEETGNEECNLVKEESKENPDDEITLQTSRTRTNKTKELLLLAKQSASQKLASLIPSTPAAVTVQQPPESKKKVLIGKESPVASAQVKKCPLLTQTLESPTITTNAATAVVPSIKLFSNNCAECGLKMTLLKPFTCARCHESFCPEHAPRSFSGLSFELLIQGRWMRVCEACHEAQAQRSKPSNPTSRSLFGFFSQVRAEFHDFREIEATRLQRRLEKLADFQERQESFAAFERKIVPWQADESSATCPFCLKEFNALQRRKHHCRLCGRLTCHTCLAPQKIPLRLPSGQVQVIKNCKTCHLLLFRPKPEPLPASIQKLTKLYQTASALKIQILETIPKFNELLLRPSRSPQQVHDIWALRDTLILVSLHFKSTLCELADLAESEGSVRWRVLAVNVRRAGNLFIQQHMFTLQILEEEEEQLSSNPVSRSSNAVSNSPKTTSPGYKKFIPDALIEAFTLTENENASQVSLGLYEQDGNPVLEANREAIELKRAVLKEQLEQMRKALKAEESVEAKVAIEESIDHLSRELKKLSRINL